MKKHSAKPVVLDEDDCPEITDEMFAAGVTYNPPKRVYGCKLVITGKKDGIVHAKLVHGGAHRAPAANPSIMSRCASASGPRRASASRRSRKRKG